MKQNIFTIDKNIKIAENVYEMCLSGEGAAEKPGQFVNIKIGTHFLRRPISVCDYGKNSLTIIYKTVGKGTLELSQMAKGEKLDVLCALGNGYNADITLCGKKPLLIGGGVGVPPLYALAKRLIESGCEVTVIEGFNTIDEVFYKEQFEALGAKVIITTADGSFGQKGFVTDAIETLDYSYVYTCGPEPMLKAVYSKTDCSGQYSFEERMACGFGVCMGCSCKTKYGSKRICTDGPVLLKEEIVW